MKSKFTKLISSPKIFSYTVLWMIILVFFGTIAQKDIGLYESQMRYFSSYYFFLGGFIPLPGGRLILLVMTINLAASLFKKNLWKIKKTGIIIVHLGGLLLLLGGAVGGALRNRSLVVLYMTAWAAMSFCLYWLNRVLNVT